MRRMKRSWKHVVAMLLVVAMVMPFITPAARAIDWREGMTAYSRNPEATPTTVAADAATKIEAEAALCFYPTSINRSVGPATKTAGTTGYSGDAFVTGFTSNPGAYIEFPLNVEQAGKYNLTVGYANGNATQAKPEFYVYVNDTKVDTYQYAYTGDNGEFSNKWFNTGTHTVEIDLTAGTQNLRIVAGEQLGTNAINLDYIVLEISDENYLGDAEHNSGVTSFTIAPYAANKFEAEDAKRYWPAEATNEVTVGDAGEFSGEGYVSGFAKDAKSYIEFPVSVLQAGTYKLQVRYASSNATASEYTVYLDGVAVDTHSYESTDGAWSTYEVEVDLTTAAKSLKFVAVSASDGINIDYIAVPAVPAAMTAGSEE